MRLNAMIWRLLVCLMCYQGMGHAQNTVQQVEENRKNAPFQQHQPYVILISADGFRHDYAEKYEAKNLLALREKGVRASAMKPSFPSFTFPNHYTLATGMYPVRHGIVNNSFYHPAKKQFYGRSNPSSIQDSSWYRGIPIWTLAEQQQMLSATFYWVGSEAAIAGIRPSYWYHYNDKISIDDRIGAIKKWLQLPEEKRPHLINFYFPEVDMAGHRFGAESKEVAEAVKLVDDAIGKMVQLTTTLGLEVNFVFVSDHGMTNVDPINTLSLPTVIDREKFIVPNGDALIHIYAKDRKDIKPLYKSLRQTATDYEVYLANKMPRRWHYRSKNNQYSPIGDIILMPNPPKIFNLTDRPTALGKHGFDNDMPDMQAVFYAWGPAFKQGYQVAPFENIHVYPLLAKILGLSYHHQIDGDIKVLQSILKP